MGAPRDHCRIGPLRSVTLGCALLLGASGLAANGLGPHPIPRLESSVVVDGALDEPAWQRAWSMTLDWEVQPGENTPAAAATEVLVYHDEGRLYVGFRAHDPDPASIRAHLADRDSFGPDDAVGVVLDTFNDQRRNYLFLINPLGVQHDAIETMDGQTPWDGIWTSAATITDWGWTAELAIPFSTLRFQRSGSDQVWGFDAVRLYPRNLYRQMGSFPRDRSDNCYLCQAHKISGFAGVSPGRNLEIVPTVTASRTDTRPELAGGSLEEGDPESDLGATVRWGVTPNLTVSAAWNPDFSQVEADAVQLSVNRPFAIFFPELRPFFMEGADYFDTSLDAVYTRMMREPAWGVKLTGQEGAHTVGAYVVDDEVTNLIIPGSQASDLTTLERSNTATVLRYKFDLGERFTVGGLATDREGGSYLNRVVGADADLRLSPRDRVVAQVLGSRTRYPDEVARDFGQPTGTFDDWAAEVMYFHETRTWQWWGAWADVGADFRADLGFMPQVGYRHAEAGGGYNWNPTATSWYARIQLLGKIARTDDQDGFVLFHEDVVQLTVEGPLQSHSVVRPSRVREGYGGREFDFNRLRFHVCARPNRHSHVWLNVNGGGQVDYDNVRPGDFLTVDGGLWYRFGRHLLVEPQLARERMEVDGGWLYTSTVGQLTGAWQFNARCQIRAILQLVDNRFNTELYSDGRDAETRNLFSQLLFSYKVNPRTVLFVGYSDTSGGTEQVPLRQADRTLFVKLGYAWVL
ncbi:MAG TPA: DUF5916 domain-containing protein [Methylomirabilota bacterium]|nr:DUF5916 domain-containing protein [Methylomirabilota bacterium]